MDEKDKAAIDNFVQHLRNLSKDQFESGMESTGLDTATAAHLIEELARSIDLEGMRFRLETILP